jgi:competence protein ComEA
MKVIRTILAAAIVALPLFAYAEPVDVNTADAATISKSLKGIGMAKAEAIVEYRTKHGPFKNADELSLVKGIGERTIEINRADIKVGPVEG